MKKPMVFGVACFLAMAFATTAFAAGASKLKLSVLVDDTVASDKYLTEHGVSILVELPNGHRW